MPRNAPSIPSGADPATAAPVLVSMQDITKRFGAVEVLQGVDFEVRRGEVHVLAGENGAGKSTLIKILAGVYTDYEGCLEIAGRAVRPRSPQEARTLGVAVIHQELSLIGPMSVADNIFLGRTPTRAGLVQDSRQEAEALRWISQLGLDLDVSAPVETHSLAVQQQIEIAKALSQEAKVLVLDEPTSALNAADAEKLFSLIAVLRQRGVGLVYITHKMEEIERLADRITVLRDGRWIGCAPARELPPARLIQWMVGRELVEYLPRRTTHSRTERLRLENFSVFPGGSNRRAAVRDVSLTVNAGEIVGLCGVQGSGGSELLLGLFGAYGAATQGRAQLDGRMVSFSSPRCAIEAGVALLTNNRKATGLVLPLSITANATLAGLRALSPGGWRSSAREAAAAAQATGPMKLHATSLEQEVGALSGGNQQKVALAKWLQTNPRLLLLDEPTRGIDVGAKREIYQLMEAWTAAGIGILLITSEMPELLALSDRIIVLHRGQVTAEFSREEASPESLLAAAMGQPRASRAAEFVGS